MSGPEFYARPAGQLRDLVNWRGARQSVCWACGPALLPAGRAEQNALHRAAPPGDPDDVRAWQLALIAEAFGR